MIKRIIFIGFYVIMSHLSNGQEFRKSQDSAGIDYNFAQKTYNGGGAAWVDLDNDGDDDLYLVGGDKTDKIYINNGDGTFGELANPGLEQTENFYTTGVIYGDLDNDGDKDVFVNTYFSDTEAFCKNLLYINNGDLTFTESWEWDREEDKSMTMGSVFIDYNLDGLLDIYTVNYVEVAQFTFDDQNMINGFDHECFVNRMYRNDGNLNFTDVTDEQGLGNNGCALAVTATDYDGDHDLDLLLGNDFGPFLQGNRMYQNDRVNNIFKEQSEELGANTEMFSMGIAVADYDNDLDLDYYISNLAANVLLENNDGIFNNVSEIAQVKNTYAYGDSTLTVSWGNLFADIDNDGDEDLFVANGYVPAPESLATTSILDPDRLFVNNGDKTFTMLDSTIGITNEFPSRGAAYSDYDMDGDIDILSVVFDKPNFGENTQTVLYENITENDNNWIGVILEGTQVNKDAFGSKIYVHTPNNIYLRELSGGASFCSQHTSTLHVGIGLETQVDSIVVIWTGGKNQQTEQNILTNTITKIVENMTVAVDDLNLSTLSAYPNPTRGNVTILLPDHVNGISKVNVFNALGARVFLGYEHNENKIKLDLNSQFGYYLVQIIDKHGKIFQSKIMKI